MDQETFAKRLSSLRINKNVSARDMSLSIGQSPSYINNIESGRSLPSLMGLFYICEYLGITPKEFFDTDIVTPTKIHELVDATKSLNVEQLDHLIAIAQGLKR